ncbi:Piso0_004817 [Millerozyma farinosa CBS 7064]|uniref:Piso0_004817 protein n=1 Tax=Pichia sorbitophila (strain ATCC MYA-4447 / BCRC 22081 / CBS 7064 / NBRC 10061 / NRRL Y-12695) TaxID=559304 RepID=G8Y3G7_PICSO|nr:Piso0_004817 [Millerozyma farinosa CBS 7064]
MNEQLHKTLKSLASSDQACTIDENDWKNKALPGILESIEQIGSTSIEIEKSSPHDQEAIRKLDRGKLRLISHLKAHFGVAAPFTIRRIAELLLDPKKEGYTLNTLQEKVKFFNALSKSVLVSSALNEFPVETFNANDNASASEDVNSVDKMVRIPWSKQANEKDSVFDPDLSNEESK